jgi:membrane-bound serine protease (ClpP class)
MHKRFFFGLLFFIGLVIGGLNLQTLASAQDSDSPIILMDMDGAIGPAFADYLEQGIAKASATNAQLILIKLNTPGGLLTSTREMVSAIVESPVPVAIWVTPSGAHAASAGTFLMYAAHIAAMDESTNLGAATPIQMQGSIKTQAPSQEEQQTEEDSLIERLRGLTNTNEEASRKKAVEDSAALIRGLAEMRGRNSAWAERAVIEGESITAREALNDNVITFKAPSLQSLLAQMDGQTITLKNDESVTLQTTNATIKDFAPSWKTKFLSLITDPNIAVILMTIGVYGLILEFYNPGTLIPGTIGIISLVIGLYAMNTLPINITGIVLIGIGVVFMIAESFIPSFGVLGFGGLAAFILGATIMFDTELMPGMALDGQVIAGIAALGALTIALAAYLTWSVYKKRMSTGVESLVSATAEIIEWSGDQGRVRVQGEIWQAYSDEALKFSKGDKVVVAKVEELTLKIITP